jgi:hypothetical protein
VVDSVRAILSTAAEQAGVTSGDVGDEQLSGRLIREHAASTGRTSTEVVADTE